jgi:hypothetical protein
MGLVLLTAATAAVLVYIASAQQVGPNSEERSIALKQQVSQNKTREEDSKRGKSRRAQLKAASRAREMNNKGSTTETAPQTERNLPAALAMGNGRITVPRVSIGELKDVDIVAKMAEALASELFELNVPGSITQALEAYILPKFIKRTINYNSKDKKGTIHHRIIECTKFCELYELLIQRVIAPYILREFMHESAVESTADAKAQHTNNSEFDKLGKSNRTVLYQFPPTIRIYCSHIEPPDTPDTNRQKRTTPLVGEMGAAERQQVIEAEQQRYRNLGRVHTDSGDEPPCTCTHTLHSQHTREG